MKTSALFTGISKKSRGRPCLPALFFFFMALFTCFAVAAEARTDLFFMAPVSGQAGGETAVPMLLKGERLQSGAVDFLYDSRYVSPVFINGNLIKVDRGALASRGNPFFFAAARLDELFDETRPYLRTIRFSFAFQTPVSSVGVEELAIFHFQLDSLPAYGLTLLQVIKNTPSMADLALYRQGGGIILFDRGGILPGITIESPENEKRYEETSILLKASIELSGNNTGEVYWADPFAISEPLSDPLIATGIEETVEFEPGIHALWGFVLDSAGNASGKWTVFGVREDVIVTVFGEIDARVVESTSSEPVSGARVILWSGDRIITSCFTGADGLCVFDGLEEGTYRVEARKEFYDGYSVTVQVPKDETVAVTLPILSLIPPSDQVYEYSSVKICVHRGSAAGDEVPGADVREIRGSYECVTGEDGCCYVDRVRRGVDLYWHAGNGELFSELEGPVKFSSTNEELTIVVNPTSATAIRLEALDPLDSYKAVPGLSATLQDAFNVIKRVTDSSGNAEFSPVSPDSSCNLIVNTPEKSGPDNTTWYAGQELDVPGSDVADGRVVPLRLPFAGLYASLEQLSDSGSVDPSARPSMEFHVTDLSDKPLAGVSVILKQSGLTRGPLLTDGNGKAVAEELLPGDVEAVLSRSGYQGVKIEAVLTAGARLTRYVKMGKTLSAITEYHDIGGGDDGGDNNSTCPAIEITVKNPSTAMAIPGLAVKFVGKASGNTLYSGILDNSGKIMFKNVDLSESPFDVHVSRSVESDNATVAWDEVNIFSPVAAREGYLTKYTFYFVPDSTSLSLKTSPGSHPLLTQGRFIVMDNSGHPVNDARVKILSTGDNRVFNLQTDEYGVAEFTHDFPGIYHVTVLADGRQGVEFDTLLGIGTTYIFDVGLHVVPVIFRPVSEACSGGTVPQPDLKAAFALSVVNASTGQVVPDLQVAIYDKTGRILASGATDSNGKWDILEIEPASSVTVTAWWKAPSGNWTEMQEASFDLRGGVKSAVSMFVSPGASKVSSVQEGGGNSSGRGRVLLQVVDVNNTPLYRVKVTVRNQDGHNIRTMYTGSDGRASVTDMTPGAYSLHISGDNHLYMLISSITVWQESDFAWKVTLPESGNYVRGEAEDALRAGKLLALVVNGDTFKPLAGVSVRVTPLSKSATSLPATLYTDSYGRLTVNGLDAAGPVNLALDMTNYMERNEGPLHITNGETRYALYAMTPEKSVVRAGNPDNVPAGRTFWFPEEGRGIVKHGAGLTVFSYDPVLMTVTRRGYVSLPDISSEMMAAVSMPLEEGSSAMSSASYLIAVKTSRSVITLYRYEPFAGDAVLEAGTITVAGDLHDVLMHHNRLVAATSTGLLFYSLVDDRGMTAPALKASVDLPAIRVLGSGKGILAFTEQGEVASIDASTPDMPVITGKSRTGFIPRSGAADWKYIFMEDEAGLFHSAKITGSETFFMLQGDRAAGSAGGSAGGSLTTPSVWVSGQTQHGVASGKTPKIAMTGSRTFAFVMTQQGVSVMELTDNSMLQTGFYPLPSPPEDIVFAKRRMDDQYETCMLAMTDSGIYTIPMPDDTDASIHIDLDLAALTPDGTGTWYAWTSPGRTWKLEAVSDENGRHLYWRADLPAGVYNFSLVDSGGTSRFDFSSFSLFQQAVSNSRRLTVSLDLQRSDGSRAANFMPGQEIFVNIDVDVWQNTVTDGYLVVTYQPDGSEKKFYCPATVMEDGTYEIAYCHESDEELAPLLRSWPARPVKGMTNRLLRLPEGSYGGAGMISLFFNAPGNGSNDPDNAYARSDAPFRIGWR